MNEDPFASLNFPKPFITKDLWSIANFFKKSESRCGIYMFSLPYDLFYIGQSIDVVKRFAQHKRSHPVIYAFSFLPTPPCNLDKIEQQLILEAQRKEISLANKEYVQDIIGKTDFDLLVSKDEQDAWLHRKNKTTENIRINDLAHRKRYIPEFNQFLKHPKNKEVIHLLKKYILECIPYPKRTEFSFWSVSCCPKTNKNTYPRLVCVNIHMMETFVIGYDKTDPDNLWSFIVVSKNEFDRHYKNKMFFRIIHPNVSIHEHKYKSASGDSINIETTVECMSHLLDENAFIDAARNLDLRLMRKGATVMFSRYHCFQLADRIFNNLS